MAETVWLGGIPGSYHDSQCPCEDHCRNCFEDLPTIRRSRNRLIAEGKLDAEERLGEREKYCCPYCRNRAKRERALDRALAAIDHSARGEQP